MVKECPSRNPLQLKPMPKFGNFGPNYEGHLKILREMTSQIDNKAPHLYPALLMKLSKASDDTKRLEAIAIDNERLVRTVNMIHRTKGEMDTFNPMAGIHVSKLQTMHGKNKAITEHNLNVRRYIMTAKPLVVTRKQCLEDWKDILHTMNLMTKYPLHFSSAKVKPKCSKKFPTCRPRCYMDLEIEGGTYLGRMIFELYGDSCPVTVRNFLEICSGGPGCRGLTYEGSPIHRIIPGLYCQGGDIIAGNGSDGVSIYGKTFPEENFEMKHDRPGILSMCSFDGENHSQFNLTFNPLPPIDGRRVVFGRLVQGIKTLQMLEGCGRSSGRPTEKIIVKECGQYLSETKHVSCTKNMEKLGIDRVYGEPRDPPMELPSY